jgi:hypothetical protein
MRYHLHLYALLALAPLALPARASVTVYVNAAATGNLHDGHSWAAAFRTIDEALTQAGTSTYVEVATGFYKTHTPIRAGVGLSGGYKVTPEGAYLGKAGPEATVLEGEYPAQAAVEFAPGAGPDTALSGFTVRANEQCGAIHFQGASPTIANNIVTRVSRVFYPPSPAPGLLSCGGNSSPTIIGNVFTGSGGHAMDCGSGNPVIVGNTFVGNNDGGVVLYAYSRAWIANNIFAKNRVGIWSNNPALTVVRNNCFYRNNGGDYQGPYGAIPIADLGGNDLPVFANISADPHFAAPDIGNYHIPTDSPCRDAGSDADAPYRPGGFRSRYLGDHVDIGAYQSEEPVGNTTPMVVRVSTQGDDSNGGASWATAKRTVQAAVDAVAPTGGEVWVAAGEYADDSYSFRAGTILLPAYVSLYGGFAGTESSRAERDWKANVASLVNHQTSLGVVASLEGRWNARVDGFTIHAAREAGKPGGTALYMRGGSPIIENCILTGDGEDTALIRGEYTAPLITHCVLTDCNSTAPPARFEGSAPEFDSDILRNNSCKAGILDGSHSAMLILRNCLVEGNNSVGSSVIAFPFPSPQYDGRLINNTFVRNSGNVYYMPRYSPSVSANNIFALNEPALSGAPYDSPQTRNNAFYPASFTADAQGNIAADPKFMDADHGDYRLADASPCIDSGDSSLVAPGGTDLVGAPRIQGRRVDIGAYESAHAVPTPNFLDVLDALKIAAGLRAAAPNEVQWLSADPANPAVGITDALILLKKLSPAN